MYCAYFHQRRQPHEKSLAPSQPYTMMGTQVQYSAGGRLACAHCRGTLTCAHTHGQGHHGDDSSSSSRSPSKRKQTKTKCSRFSFFRPGSERNPQWSLPSPHPHERSWRIAWRALYTVAQRTHVPAPSPLPSGTGTRLGPVNTWLSFSLAKGYIGANGRERGPGE